MKKSYYLGLDIGGTLIGMHLKRVAVPVRLAQRTIGEAMAYYEENAPKGEFVLVVAGCKKRQETAVTLEDAVAQVLALKAQGHRLKDAAKEVAEHTGLSKNELYAAALEK